MYLNYVSFDAISGKTAVRNIKYLILDLISNTSVLLIKKLEITSTWETLLH